MNMHSPPPDAAYKPSATVDRKALQKALDTVIRAVESKASIPALTRLHLRASPAGITITGTNLDVQIDVEVEADADPGVDALLPAKMLVDIVRKSPKADVVRIEMDPSCVDNGESNRTYCTLCTVEIGSARFDLDLIDPYDFPVSIGNMEKPVSFDMPGGPLFNALDTVRPAMSVEETRYYLNGVFMHYCPEVRLLHFVATDGHRLYRQSVSPPKGAAKLKTMAPIIPRGFVDIVHAVLKKGPIPETVRTEVNDGFIRLSLPGVTIFGKLIDGTFPDYARILPTEHKHTVTIDSAALTEAVNTVTIVSTERGRAVTVEPRSDGTCLLRTTNPEAGRATATVPCEASKGVPTFGVNGRYLLDMARTACPIGGDLVFEFEDPGSPIAITGEQSGFTAAQMPMRI